MSFQLADIINYNSEKYVVLNIVEENGVNYAFANRLNDFDNEPTDDFSVFYIINNKILMVLDNTLISKVIQESKKQIANKLIDLVEKN